MIDKLLLGGYIGFMVGFSCHAVGQSTGPEHLYPWWLPMMMFATISVPAALGYLIGKAKP